MVGMYSDLRYTSINIIINKHAHSLFIVTLTFAPYHTAKRAKLVCQGGLLYVPTWVWQIYPDVWAVLHLVSRDLLTVGADLRLGCLCVTASSCVAFLPNLHCLVYRYTRCTSTSFSLSYSSFDKHCSRGTNIPWLMLIALPSHQCMRKVVVMMLVNTPLCDCWRESTPLPCYTCTWNVQMVLYYHVERSKKVNHTGYTCRFWNGVKTLLITPAMFSRSWVWAPQLPTKADGFGIYPRDMPHGQLRC